MNRYDLIHNVELENSNYNLVSANFAYRYQSPQKYKVRKSNE